MKYAKAVKRIRVAARRAEASGCALVAAVLRDLLAGLREAHGMKGRAKL